MGRKTTFVGEVTHWLTVDGVGVDGLGLGVRRFGKESVMGRVQGLD